MNFEFLTICLNGSPWIQRHISVFNALPKEINWRWTIAHGVSANMHDTRWMASQLPGLSTDGTTEYLEGLARQHPRVRVFTHKLWHGKTQQINACLQDVEAPAIILQLDADEIWTTAQLERMHECFCAEDYGVMQFKCRYFLGPNIVASREGSYGCRNTEWIRAWRMTDSSQRFITHEPPNFAGNAGLWMFRQHTADAGLVFDHHAYALESQVAYKERVYKYPGAVAGWRRLQANTVWPTKLKPFLPWVDDLAEADLLIR